MKQLADLTDLQLAVLSVVWKHGEASAHTVHQALTATHGLARGTIGTLLHRLERQRVLTHRRDGREYLYRATIPRESVRDARLKGLIGGLFDGDPQAMVSFAIGHADLRPADRDRLRALLAAHKRPGRR